MLAQFLRLIFKGLLLAVSFWVVVRVGFKRDVTQIGPVILVFLLGFFFHFSNSFLSTGLWIELVRLVPVLNFGYFLLNSLLIISWESKFLFGLLECLLDTFIIFVLSLFGQIALPQYFYSRFEVLQKLPLKITTPFHFSQMFQDAWVEVLGARWIFSDPIWLSASLIWLFPRKHPLVMFIAVLHITKPLNNWQLDSFKQVH